MEFPNFSFDIHPNPTLSIITLLYNKVHLTEKFLKSLRDNVSIPFQLILFDNASTDDTHKLLEKIDGALILKSSQNLQFIKGNNLASVAATGKYLLFLNNDTEIQKSSLESMVETIETESNCLAVASKIIFPTGLLQEAGSIVWSNGSCLGYGRGEKPDKPEFNYRRDVDYGSAACLLVRKNTFVTLGGFDERYSPAYYEDTDLCMKLRSAGGRIIYDPRAEIIHHEYSSSSPEAAVAKMREREIIFRTKWNSQLLSQHEPDLRNVLLARDNRPMKTLLYIDDRIPTPDEGSGWPRAYGILKLMAKSFKVTIFPKQDSKARQPWTNHLENMGIECIHDGRSFSEFCESRSNFYQLLFVSRPHNFEQILPEIETNFKDAKVVYDGEALYYARERIKRKLRGVADDESLNVMMMNELRLLESADISIMVSQAEADAIRHERKAIGLLELNNIHVLGYGLNTVTESPGFNGRENILFVGAFNGLDTPNEDAILYFIEEIFPIIRKRIGCKLIVAGPTPPSKLLAFADADIDIVGFVPDLTPLYNSSKIFIVPHRFAAGIALKLSESLAMGLPTVCTPLIAAQFKFDNQGPVMIGLDPLDFAEKIISLYTDSEMWNRKQTLGLEYISKTHDPLELGNELIMLLSSMMEIHEKN